MFWCFTNFVGLRSIDLYSKFKLWPGFWGFWLTWVWIILVYAVWSSCRFRLFKNIMLVVHTEHTGCWLVVPWRSCSLHFSSNYDWISKLRIWCTELNVIPKHPNLKSSFAFFVYLQYINLRSDVFLWSNALFTVILPLSFSIYIQYLFKCATYKPMSMKLSVSVFIYLYLFTSLDIMARYQNTKKNKSNSSSLI